MTKWPFFLTSFSLSDQGYFNIYFNIHDFILFYLFLILFTYLFFSFFYGYLFQNLCTLISHLRTCTVTFTWSIWNVSVNGCISPLTWHSLSPWHPEHQPPSYREGTYRNEHMKIEKAKSWCALPFWDTLDSWVVCLLL